jgi:predicted transcriptional regulator
VAYGLPSNGGGAVTVPVEFIPDGYHQLTNYTEENLDALAEDIAAGRDAPAAEVLEMLEALVHGYNVPVTEAERSARNEYGEGEL